MAKNKTIVRLDKQSYSSDEPDASPVLSSENPKTTSRTNSFEIENLLKTAEQVTGRYSLVHIVVH